MLFLQDYRRISSCDMCGVNLHQPYNSSRQNRVGRLSCSGRSKGKYKLENGDTKFKVGRRKALFTCLPVVVCRRALSRVLFKKERDGEESTGI